MFEKSITYSKRILSIACAVSLSAAFLHADENEASSAMSPPELFGVMVGQQVGLDDLGFSDEEKQLFLAGMKNGVMGTAPEDIQAQLPRLQQFLQQRAEAAQSELMAELESEQEALLADLMEDPDVIQDSSGFFYEIVKPGDDLRANETDTVLVHYTGTLVDGTEFDSSYSRGEPASFGMDRVIEGFSGGLSKIGQGGEVIIYIPAELGYGDNPDPRSGIPPGAMLIFDAELIEVIPAGGE